ncbi:MULTISPECIES: hypothetical protein [unclassified Bradyrhizobium]|uniref:hypothetical protein n=1 Tax=unclassified Bradyrhizobium TaxID=2631580 RepID=UPI0028EBFE3D|nr:MULTISPECIES: hypothetical protein [unclassified Bradyrhizobium]
MTLFKQSISDYLTAAPPDQIARATHPGMAHFAGSGPALKTCRDCRFWEHDHDYYSRRSKHHGRIRPARCRKFRQLTNEVGAPIPDDAAACRHFEEADAVPARFASTTTSTRS